MKLYPYGCSHATGESVSLVINTFPGEFDPIFSWPFKLIFRINVINLSEPSDIWTKIVEPKDNQNSVFFIRPCTSYGNPSICFPLLIPHSQLFKSSSPFILNDTMDVHRSQPGRTKMNNNNLCTPVTFSSILKPG